MNFKDAYIDFIRYKKTKLKPESVSGIVRTFKKYILPYFEKKDINSLTLSDYRNWQEEMLKKELSDEYLKNIHYIFVSFYNYLNDFYGIKNIAKIIGVFPYRNAIQNDHKIWNRKETEKFLKTIDDDIYKVMFEVLIKTGIRKSECMALNFNDIKKYYININKTISKELINGKRIITYPKTKNSIRKVYIDKLLYKKIIKLKKHYANFNNDMFVFGGSKPISNTTLKRKKDYYCKKAKVKQITLHEIRHTNATFLYNNNVDLKTIQSRLGHSDINTTMNVYIHKTEEQKKVLKVLSSLKV